jgi:hypothetical protein
MGWQRYIIRKFILDFPSLPRVAAMLLSDCPELHIQHDASLLLLRSAWTGTGSGANLRTCADRLLAILQQHQPRHYLMELDGLDDLSIDDQLWLSADWLPLVQQLPLHRVALLIGDRRIHNKMAVDSLIALGSATFPFEVQFFVDPRNAIRWLTNDSPRVPGLLAEWDESFCLVSVRHPMQVALGRAARTH